MAATRSRPRSRFGSKATTCRHRSAHGLSRDEPRRRRQRRQRRHHRRVGAEGRRGFRYGAPGFPLPGDLGMRSVAGAINRAMGRTRRYEIITSVLSVHLAVLPRRIMLRKPLVATTFSAELRHGAARLRKQQNLRHLTVQRGGTDCRQVTIMDWRVGISSRSYRQAQSPLRNARWLIFSADNAYRNHLRLSPHQPGRGREEVAARCLRTADCCAMISVSRCFVASRPRPKINYTTIIVFHTLIAEIQIWHRKIDAIIYIL